MLVDCGGPSGPPFLFIPHFHTGKSRKVLLLKVPSLLESSCHPDDGLKLFPCEDRATERNGKSDKISMKYIIIDVGSGEEIASTGVSVSRKWATLGGDHPEDFVPQTVQDLIDSLFK